MNKYKKALIIFAIVFVCVVVLLPVISLYALGLYANHVLRSTYDERQEAEDGFTYLIRDPNKKAGIDRYIYDPSVDEPVVLIPETYGEYPVEGLGGFLGRGVPSRFCIEIKGIKVDTPRVHVSDDSFDWRRKEDIETEYVDLTLRIGANIREIDAAQFGYDTGEKLYVVRVYVCCDPDNRWYYSQDGVLYSKEDGEIVKGFLYWNKDY